MTAGMTEVDTKDNDSARRNLDEDDPDKVSETVFEIFSHLNRSQG